MDSASTQLGQMLPPSRRPYNRKSPQQWEDQKELIHSLFIDQNKTHKEVVHVLKEYHDFDVGERQMKRKTDEWGFIKNIPSNEMRKMIRKRTKREDELERPTKFLRRQGTHGDFQEVAQQKLDKFQKRFEPDNVSSMSTSSGTPSNIMYYTPSAASQNLHPDSPGRLSERTREFNDLVELTFESTERDGANRQTVPPSSLIISSCGKPVEELLYDSACDLVFDGKYSEAKQDYKLAAIRSARLQGPNSGLAVITEFQVALMSAAEFPGCPQSITARVAQELCRFLLRERQRYDAASPEERNLPGLRKILTGLRMNASWTTKLVTLQRALQIWEPILGPLHSKIRRIRANIARMKKTPTVNLAKETWRTKGAEDVVPEIFRPDSNSQLTSIGNMLHLCDGSPSDLLQKFHSLESSDILSRQFQKEIKLLQYGRSRSLLGLYHSFLHHFDDAEKAFQESNQHMQYESCVEIKLHRILWYAEHKTRVRDEKSVGDLMRQAHEIFMTNDHASSFIITHFPTRFHHLCEAVSKRVSVDEVLNETADESGASQRHRSGSLAASSHCNDADDPSHSGPVSPISALERLFPATPRGFNSAIDVDTWREFVNFSHHDG